MKVYFAVPTHYTIGPEFETFADAVAYARGEQVQGGRSREFVDLRELSATGDRPLQRWEVFPDSVERSEVSR